MGSSSLRLTIDQYLLRCYAITIDLLQSYFRMLTWRICLRFSLKTLVDILKHLVALLLMSFLRHYH